MKILVTDGYFGCIVKSTWIRVEECSGPTYLTMWPLLTTCNIYTLVLEAFPYVFTEIDHADCVDSEQHFLTITRSLLKEMGKSISVKLCLRSYIVIS